MSHSRDWNILSENPVHKLYGVDITAEKWHVEALPNEELIKRLLVRDEGIKNLLWIFHLRSS